MNKNLSVRARLRECGLVLGFVAALAAALSLVATAAPSQALSPDKGVINHSNISLGLIEIWPGQTSTYDFYIPAHTDSQSVDYAAGTIQGVYIGPGYCAQRWTYPTKISPTSTLWRRAGADFPPGRHQLLGDFWVKIVAYRGTC